MLEQVIQIVTASRYPASGENLAGFSTDAEHYLGKGGVLSDIDVHQTGQPECLLEIRATVTNRAHTLQEVSTVLRQTWLALAYSEFEASSCVWYSDGTVLRFVTATERGERGNLYVTGEVVASGGPYASLAERFERDFGDVRGGLKPMPKREP